MVTLTVDEAEHATILAALRFYQENGQGNPDNRSDAIHDIAMGGATDDVISLDADGIDALCERINAGGPDPIEILGQILDAGEYDDQGDFVVPHVPWNGEGDPPDTSIPQCLIDALQFFKDPA